MINILDLSIVVLFLIFAVIGYKKGFFTNFIKLGGTVLSLLVSVLTYPVITKIFFSLSFDEKISNYITKNFLVVDSDPYTFDKLPYFVRKAIYNSIDATIESTAMSITNIVITILSVITVFILAKIIVNVITNMLKNIIKLPVLRKADNLLGLFFGLLNCYIITSVLFGVSSLFFNLNFIDYINSSSIASMLYKNNILFQILLN